MKIKVTQGMEDLTLGDLFFDIPTNESLDRVEEDIADICYNKLIELNISNEESISMLEIELDYMRRTKTAYHFMMIREIMELSNKHKYPIMVEGNLSYSIIAYLLGIVSDRVFTYKSSMYPECIWGCFQAPQKPDFSIRIASSVRNMIPRYLNKKYSYVESDNSLFCQINVIDSELCEEIGGQSNDLVFEKIYNNDTYLNVLKYMADELCVKKEWVSDETHIMNVSLANELRNMNLCDFDTLVKIFAYIHGSFAGIKTLDKIYNKDFFVTRDDFFEALICNGMPREIALDVVKKGVWSQNEKRVKYNEILLKYNIPKQICEYFDNVSNLWNKSSCASRVELLCMLELNKENKNIFDFESVIEKLKKRNILYTSEAEFQFDVMNIIKELYPEATVRCEFGTDLELYNANMEMQKYFVRIDIIVCLGGGLYPMEVKFRRTKLEKPIKENGLDIIYKEQDAPDDAIYNYIRDIHRVENFCEKHKCTKGYTIFLTNQVKYTNGCYSSRQTLKELVNLCEDGKIKISSRGNGRINGVDKDYVLKNHYESQWEDFDIQDNRFYLIWNEINIGNI